MPSSGSGAEHETAKYCCNYVSPIMSDVLRSFFRVANLELEKIGLRHNQRILILTVLPVNALALPRSFTLQFTYALI